MPIQTFADVARQRLRNQRLIGAPLSKPEQVVAWLGAVQSQDYGGAKWGLAQRTRSGSDQAIDAAFQSGRIVRTHVLRPTWHFVLPADVRWLLTLTAPRVRPLLALYDRKLEIDAALRRRCRGVLERVLRDGQHLTREELGQQLAASGIAATGQRLGHLIMHAELDAQICSGPRRGNKFTYALLEERVPATELRAREQSLAELALRYFTSHGPALAQDFAWWSGLTVADAKLGIELNGKSLREARVDDKPYWFTQSKALKIEQPIVHLLPNYDEHVGSYKDYGASFDRERVRRPGRTEAMQWRHTAVLDGRVIGGWQRTLAKDHVAIVVRLLTRLTADEREALHCAAQRYGAYVQLPVRLTIRGR